MQDHMWQFLWKQYDHWLQHSLPAHFFAILKVFPAFVYNSAASSVLDEPLNTNTVKLIQHSLTATNKDVTSIKVLIKLQLNEFAKEDQFVKDHATLIVKIVIGIIICWVVTIIICDTWV